MPRHICPDYPDCYVDCPGYGYAYFMKPYGPCKKGCDASSAGDALIEMISGATPGAIFTGIVIGITSGALAKFGHDIAQIAPPESTDDIATLQGLSILVSERRFDALWGDTDLAGVIRAFSRAAREAPKAAA